MAWIARRKQTFKAVRTAEQELKCETIRGADSQIRGKPVRLAAFV
jgi:hypothetical protein